LYKILTDLDGMRSTFTVADDSKELTLPRPTLGPKKMEKKLHIHCFGADFVADLFEDIIL
jgi:hypothetical protein